MGVSPVNNVVIVSGELWRESAIHIHESILPPSLLPSRLAHDIEQSSMCYTVGPCWLPILQQCVHDFPKAPNCPFPTGNHKFIF